MQEIFAEQNDFYYGTRHIHQNDSFYYGYKKGAFNTIIDEIFLIESNPRFLYLYSLVSLICNNLVDRYGRCFYLCGDD